MASVKKILYFLERKWSGTLWAEPITKEYASPDLITVLVQTGKKVDNDLQIVDFHAIYSYFEDPAKKNEDKLIIQVPKGIRVTKKFLEQVMKEYNFIYDSQVKIARY